VNWENGTRVECDNQAIMTTYLIRSRNADAPLKSEGLLRRVMWQVDDLEKLLIGERRSRREGLDYFYF
jgi:hypothetical protein